MKRFVKKAILLPLLSAAPVFCSAQSTVQYTYDNAGNRIVQEIVYDDPDRSQGFGTKNNDAGGGIVSGQVGGHIVRASMLSGMLRVEVLGLKPTDHCYLSVFTIGGQLLQSQVTADTLTTLDLSNQSDGVYILQVRINDEKGAWKIVKK